MSALEEGHPSRVVAMFLSLKLRVRSDELRDIFKVALSADYISPVAATGYSVAFVFFVHFVSEHCLVIQTVSFQILQLLVNSYLKATQ